MKTKLTKTITSSLSFACALGCLVAAIAVSTSATAGPAPEARACSVSTLRGLYLARWDGSANVGETLVPKAVMEGKRFNGNNVRLSMTSAP